MDEFERDSFRRALQAPPPGPGAALPYCGLNDVGCNGESPSCVCLDYLFECDPTAGTCSPMTVGMALVVLVVACVIVVVAVAICCTVGACVPCGYAKGCCKRLGVYEPLVPRQVQHVGTAGPWVPSQPNAQVQVGPICSQCGGPICSQCGSRHMGAF